MTTLAKEAHALLKQQPESNLRLIVDFLHKLSSQQKTKTANFKRTGVANGKIVLPEDFDTNFDTLDAEIATEFYGTTL